VFLRNKLVVAQIERGEESALLIAAIALWYAVISDSLEVFVYADDDTRARQIMLTVRDLYDQLPRSWRRNCSENDPHRRYIRFVGAGSVGAERVGGRINPWHDIIIVDGAESMNCEAASDLIYCGRQPLDDRRVLVVGSEADNLFELMDRTGFFTRATLPTSEPAR
jgi:hypothetical protein